MDSDTAYSWLEELVNDSTGSQRRDPLEENRDPVETFNGDENRDPVENQTKTARQYKKRFGSFCPVCGEWFPACTSRKKTCTDLCKSRLKRQRRKVKETEQDILWMIGGIQRLIESGDKVQRRNAKTSLLNIAQQALMACEEVGLKPCQP